MSSQSGIILYVPGMKPKPPAPVHRRTLRQCLLEGMRRSGLPAGTQGLSRVDFRLVPWPHEFYVEQRDFELDRPGVERLLSLKGPEPQDLEEARHWHKRLARLAYLISDAFPSLISWIANDAMKATLEDSLRYFRNDDGVGDRIRATVRRAILDARDSGERIMLMSHSLGSVIAFDTLWEMSWREPVEVEIDLFLTIGSPLGLNFVRHRLLGSAEQGRRRYPANIHRWRNLSAIGELTSLDRAFAIDYREMLDLGLVEEIVDETDLETFFRGPDGLNVHKCYGYMVNPQLGAAVAEWVGQEQSGAG